jgi:hypothetical protein
VISALADAFGNEEAKDGRVFEVRVSNAIYKAIEASGFDDSDSPVPSFWGAKVVVDDKLRKRQVVLRYERKVTQDGPKPSAENFWRTTEKLKRFHKKVTLKKRG